MLCNGVIYFVTRATNENVLLSYDTAKDEWHEEITHEECMEIFEWDGRVMTAMPLPADEIFTDETGYQISLFARNPVTKRWVDMGIEIHSRLGTSSWRMKRGWRLLQVATISQSRATLVMAALELQFTSERRSIGAFLPLALFLIRCDRPE